VSLLPNLSQGRNEAVSSAVILSGNAMIIQIQSQQELQTTVNRMNTSRMRQQENRLAESYDFIAGMSV